MAYNSLNVQVTAGLDIPKSISQINSELKKIEGQLKKLKLQATLDINKSNTEIQKQIESLNKKKKQLYVDLKLRKSELKKQCQEFQKEKIALNVDTNKAQQQIIGVTKAVQNTSNESVTLGLALKNAFNNAGYAYSAAKALEMIKQTAKLATEAIKEYDTYSKNLKIITGKDDVSDLIAGYAKKSLDMKVDISEYEAASEVILRAGKNLSENAEYTESAIKLAKTGFIESDKAAENLLIIANSYDLTADKLKNVTDALLTLDVESNTEAGALSEAMAKSAKNAQLAGLSYEKLGSIIAKLRDTTGKSESEIATSLNNIFNRTYRVKPNSFEFENENGETENLSKPLSDVEKVMNQLGISIRKSATEFKDFEEIVSTIAPVFKDLDSVSQNAISSVFAGQHKNVFLNLINDWDEIQALTDKAENSLGVTESKYTAYLDSIEGKTAKLNTATKEMWNNLVPDDLVGNLIDAGTAVIQFTDEYNILGTALKSVTFYAFAKGIIATKNSITGMISDVKNVSYAMNLATQSTAMTGQRMKELQSMTKVLSDSQLKLILSNSNLSETQMITMLRTEGVTEAEARQKLATLGITQANQQATASTFSLNGSMKTLFATISAHPVAVLTMAFTALVTVYQTVQRKQEELRQSISETAREAKEQTDSLNDLIKSYEEFADKTSYTAEEKERLKSIQEQLVDTYHTEAGGIDLVNGKYDEEIAKLKELKKEKLKDAELSLTAEREQARNDGSYDNLSNKSFDISADWFNSEDDYNKIIQELDKRVSGFTTDISLISKGLGVDSQINIFAGNAEYRIKEIKKAMEVLKEYGYTNIGLYSELNDLLSEYQGYVDTENEAVSNLAENMLQQYELDNPYNKVGKDSYLAWRDGLLATAKGDNDLKSALFNLAEQQFPDYEKYFDNLTKAKSMFVRANSASEASWAKEKDNFLVGLSDEDLAIAVQIPNLFAEGLEGATAKIEAWKSDPNNTVTAETDTSSLDNLQKAYDNLSKSASSYVSNQKSITSALEEQEKYGQLSAKTIQELTDAGYAQALVVDSETGAVTLNKQAYEQLNKEKKQAIILEAKQQKSDLEQKYKNERSAISDLTLEMQYANEERRKAIILELAQHGQNMAEYANMIDKINGDIVSLDAPTFGNDDKSKPLSVINFETELARRQHEINMGRMSEDEDYYNWLESAAKKAYEGLADYEDELFKYQEQVYKGRQKLAESYFNKRISELKEYAETVENTSVTSDGSKLTTSEKWREIADIYREIQNEIENRINEIVEAGAEGNKDLLDELNKQYEEYSQKISDTFKNAVKEEQDLVNSQKDKYSKLYDERISKIKEQQEAAKKAADAEIDALESKIDYLKKVNDERSSELEIEKARQELAKAEQHTRKVYGENGTVSYEQDKEAIAEANKNLNELLLKQQITALENEKSVLESIRDTESESYSQLIETLEKEQEEGERQFDILLQALDKYLNPNNTTSNADVWSELAKTEGAKYSNGTWKDKEGNIINVNDLLKNANKTDNINTDSLFKNENMQGAESSYDKIMVNLLKNMSAPQTTIDKFLKGEFTPEMMYLFKPNASNPFEAQHNSERWSRGIDDFKVANHKQEIVNNIGDIHIHKPVGDSYDLAKELQANLHNAADRVIYSNLK